MLNHKISVKYSDLLDNNKVSQMYLKLKRKNIKID